MVNHLPDHLNHVSFLSLGDVRWKLFVFLFWWEDSPIPLPPLESPPRPHSLLERSFDSPPPWNGSGCRTGFSCGQESTWNIPLLWGVLIYLCSELCLWNWTTEIGIKVHFAKKKKWRRRNDFIFDPLLWIKSQQYKPASEIDLFYVRGSISLLKPNPFFSWLVLIHVNGNTDRLYFLELQNYCRWWLQPWN